MAEGTQLPPQLIRYWVAGEGAAKIKWNTPDDFYRCRTLVNEAIVKGGGKPLSGPVISGLCATLHRLATGGFAPGHAPGEQTGKH